MSRSALTVVLSLVAVLAVGVTAVLLYDSRRSDRIAEGVEVAGIDVGGLSAGRAREILAGRLREPARRDVRVAHDGDEFRLAADEAGVQLDLDATVQEALRRSRRGTPWGRTLRALTGGRVEADVEPRLSFDAGAVDEFVERVADEADADAKEADLDPRDGRLTVIEHQEGFETDRDALRERVVDALERPRSDRELELPGETVEPDRTTSELAASAPLYLIVDRENFKLRVYEELELDRAYPIGVGRAGHETPAGSYDISNKAKDPAWYVPDQPWAGDKRGEVIPPDDPENPLVSRWLGIDDGVGIHGTDEPGSVGTRASHGCIRMLVPDVEKLYDRVPVGTPVYIA